MQAQNGTLGTMPQDRPLSRDTPSFTCSKYPGLIEGLWHVAGLEWMDFHPTPVAILLLTPHNIIIIKLNPLLKSVQAYNQSPYILYRYIV